MGEFNDAVTTLLQAFTNGLAIIRSIRHRRKEPPVEVDSGLKRDELRLRKSLKKSRVDVRNAYAHDLAKIGQSFQDGDVKAQSSLTSILFRLNAGYVNIIDRFTRGESTRTDYRTLVNLSNASRVEAMKTFEQLSLRLSQSSLALSEKSKREHHGSSKKQKRKSAAALRSNVGGTHHRHDRPKSAPNLPLKRTVGSPKTSQELVLRPKAQEMTPKMLRPSSKAQQGLEARPRQKIQAASNGFETSAVEESLLSSTMLNIARSNRISIMSFGSDSTKIGEIPERKIQRPLMLNAESENHLADTAFPLAPWAKPEKPRSRFMRLFGKKEAC